MNKLLLLCFIFSLSCSSTPESKYLKDDVEGRADEQMQIGDNFRERNLNDDAHKYYNKAQELYLLKGNNEKYILCNLKEAMLFIKEGKLEQAHSIIERMKSIDKIEHLGSGNNIKAVEARYLYAKNDHVEGNRLVIELREAFRDDHEKSAYYHFLWAENNIAQITNTDKLQLQEQIESIEKLFSNNKLINQDTLPYCQTIWAKVLLKLADWKEAEEAIKSAEKTYQLFELTGQFDRILNLYISLYSNNRNPEKEKYYQIKLNEFKQVQSKYQ